jgi:polysaccharide export outer membrane protein
MMRFCLLAAGLCACLGAQALSPLADAPAIANASDTGTYVLGPLDVVQVSVFGAPDLTTTARISAAGEIALPLLGVVRVGGLTVTQASAAIARQFESNGLLRSPHVDLFVRDFESQKATVTGAVKNPTVVRMLAPMTLGDVLAAAGGVDPLYGGTEADLTRGAVGLEKGLPAEATLDLRAPASAATIIYPGDVVRVPQAGVVYVVGAVKLPGGFALTANNRLTVLQALALAQGLGPAAAQGRSEIIRRASSGPQEIPVNLDRVLDHKDPNLALQANDILYVPPSGAKRILSRSLDAIQNLTIGLIIYRRF